jgi:TolB-like protein
MMDGLERAAPVLAEQNERFVFGRFELRVKERALLADSNPVELGERALEILLTLVEAGGALVTKSELMERVWPNVAVEENNLAVQISALRRALGNDRRLICTVAGRGYRFIGARSDPRRSGTGYNRSSTDKPSIAVLPFHNIGVDPEQELFADGIVEEMITALSRFRHLFVVARTSSSTRKGFDIEVKQAGHEAATRYVLEGSVRRAANRVRITGKLIDSSNGTHIWADRFEGTLDDVFALQDEVTASVVGAITPTLEAAEIERARRKPTDSLDAYDCYLRGASITSSTVRSANDEALRWLYRAVDLDPNFALAYAKAAQCYGFRKVNGWMAQRPEEVAEGSRVARRAIELGGDDAVALAYGGFALAYVAGELEDGAAFVDRAVSLNSNWAYAWAASAWIKLCFGEPNVAIEQTATAIRLSPLDPLMFAWQSFTALALICAERSEEAVSWATKSVCAQPDYAASLRVAAACNAFTDRLVEASGFTARVRQLAPHLSASNLDNVLPPFRRRQDRQAFVDGLRRAGLPE